MTTNLHTEYCGLATSRRLAALLHDRCDMVLSIHGDCDEYDRELPSEAELLANGVDLDVLAHNLERGLDARHFTVVMRAGMLDVCSFNDGPRTRTRAGRRDFNGGFATLANNIASGMYRRMAS